MDCARIASKLREQIVEFSGELSAGLPKVLRRFMTEMVYGVQARQSLRLTEISRALGREFRLRRMWNGCRGSWGGGGFGGLSQ